MILIIYSFHSLHLLKPAEQNVYFVLFSEILLCLGTLSDYNVEFRLAFTMGKFSLSFHTLVEMQVVEEVKENWTVSFLLTHTTMHQINLAQIIGLSGNWTVKTKVLY